MSIPEELNLEITSRDFFRILNGEELHGLKFLKSNFIDQPGEMLSFFHRIYYFDLNGQKVYSCISTVHWETGEAHTNFTHACGEPSEIGPRFCVANKEEIENAKI